MTYLLKEFIGETEESLDKSMVELSSGVVKEVLRLTERIQESKDLNELKETLKEVITGIHNKIFSCLIVDNKHTLILSEIRDLLIDKGLLDKDENEEIFKVEKRDLETKITYIIGDK